MHWFFETFLLFIIYSLMGWCIEIVAMYFHEKKLVDRGFLIGPYCPIYGVSALLMVSLLQKYKPDIASLFVMSVLVCSITEYVTSYLLEKIFKARWWDYSHMRFNVNGRICLSNSILFGFLGVLLIHFINPFMLNIINILSPIVFNIIGSSLVIIFATDLCVSFNIIRKIKLNVKVEKRDYTNDISKIVKKKLDDNSVLIRRVFNAFPDIKNIKKKSN